MNERIYINEEFKSELTNLNCGCKEDYITVYKQDGNKVFFKYGKCKLHVTKDELQQSKKETELE